MTNSDSESDSDFFDNLILQGAMEFSGVDQNGEMLYAFTNKLPEVDPEFYNSFVDRLRFEMQLLWSEGFINMEVDSVNPTIILTEKALDPDSVSQLPPHFQQLISIIKQAAQS